MLRVKKQDARRGAVRDIISALMKVIAILVCFTTAPVARS